MSALNNAREEDSRSEATDWLKESCEQDVFERQTPYRILERVSAAFK